MEMVGISPGWDDGVARSLEWSAPYNTLLYELACGARIGPPGDWLDEVSPPIHREFIIDSLYAFSASEDSIWSTLWNGHRWPVRDFHLAGAMFCAFRLWMVMSIHSLVSVLQVLFGRN